MDDEMGGGGGNKPEPPKKRKTPETRGVRTGVTNPSSNASSSRSGNSSKGTVTGEGEMFWDGEVRQTRNKHVDKGKNGEDGKPVFGLTDVIGDVKSIILLLLCSTKIANAYCFTFSIEITDNVRHHILLRTPTFMDLHLLRSIHSRGDGGPTH